MGGGRCPGLGTLAVESQFAPVVVWVYLKGRVRELPVLGSGTLQSSAEREELIQPWSTGGISDGWKGRSQGPGSFLSHGGILCMGYRIPGMQASLLFLSHSFFLQRGVISSWDGEPCASLYKYG